MNAKEIAKIEKERRDSDREGSQVEITAKAIRKLEKEDEERRKANQEMQKTNDEKREREATEAEQSRRAKLCQELVGDLRTRLVITPSASVAKLLGTDFSVELRDGPNPIDVKALNIAIDSEKWLAVLSILTKTRVMEYPDERDLQTIRQDFLSHKFLALVKTHVDLTRITPITLSEAQPLIGSIQPCDRVFVNGELRLNSSFSGSVAGNLDGYHGYDLGERWTRHPDGSGWYVDWEPIAGEIILIPSAKFVMRGWDEKMNAEQDKFESFSGRVQREDIWNNLSKNAPHFYELIPKLEEKLRLGEVTREQISELLDKACRERYKIRRKAALQM